MASGAEPIDNSMKPKRPSDSAFKQQRLPAWQPILTAGTVLPTFFVIGIAFIPVGIGLLYFSDSVMEKVIEYTDCRKFSDGREGTEKCADIIQKNPNEECECRINFTLEQDFQGNVFMYYGLTNFYQNHRRYVKSRDDKQLLGELNPPSHDCNPFDYILETNDTGSRKGIAPCGAIANSLFSDNLVLYSYQRVDVVPLLKKGIAWPSDKSIKFRNPQVDDLSKAFENFAKPIRWKRPVYELDPSDPDNNGFQNEDLIVWMRTAALPNFRKLYRIVNHTAKGYMDGLPKGEYSLNVTYNYQVNSFKGTKCMILSTTSLLGGKNPFLGIAYIVVGTICLLLGIVFLFIHIKCGKSTTEMINVNARTPYQ